MNNEIEIREKYEKLARKSILYKPFVKKKLYDSSKRLTKQKIEDSIKKYTKNKKISDNEFSYLKYDLDYCNVVYNVTYREYFVYGFRNKGHFKRNDFIANKNRQNYLYLLGTKKGQIILRDKEKAYNLLKKHYKRDLVKISKDDDYEKFEVFIKKHPIFVKKPLKSSFGNGIELVNSKNHNDKKKLFDKLLYEGTFIMEEYIKSDSAMSTLHPESLNTVRIVTYKDENNKVYIHLPFIKIGKSGSFVDNAGAGGILALVDPDTGVITTNGKDELNNVYQYHPDTNIKIKGFQIPKWDEMIKLAKTAALDFPYTRYIGWDVALSDDKGPVIVEGNGKTQFFGQQMTDEIGKRKSLEKLIKYKKLKKSMKDVEKWELKPIKYNKKLKK